MLLTMACGTNLSGDFVARELAGEQTLDNLADFGDRLHAFHQRMKKRPKQSTWRQNEQEEEEPNR